MIIIIVLCPEQDHRFFTHHPIFLHPSQTRRNKMLAPLLDLISQQHFGQMWRQLCFETGEINMELAELNLKSFEKAQDVKTAQKV